MTDIRDEYRANAEHCREMADRVLSPLDKQMWLQLAWDWSTLASVRERYGTHQYRQPVRPQKVPRQRLLALSLL